MADHDAEQMALCPSCNSADIHENEVRPVAYKFTCLQCKTHFDHPLWVDAQEEREYNMGEHIQLYLTRAQVLMLANCARKERKKAERKLAKSTFVPAEGQRHGDVSRINRMRKLEATLREYADE